MLKPARRPLLPAALLCAAVLAGPGTAALAQDTSKDVVTVTVTPGRMAIRPGDVVPIAVIFDHKPRWHTQAGAAAAGETPVDPDAIATAVSVITDDARFIPRGDSTQWPQPKVIETRAMGPASKLAVFEGRSIVYVPLEVRHDAKAGNANLGVTVTYQACDDKVCLAPVQGQRYEITLAISPDASDSGWTYPELFTEYRPVAASVAPPPIADSAGVGLVTILTAVVVGAGVIGVVVITLLRRR